MSAGTVQAIHSASVIGSFIGSLLPQQEVHDPAAPHMLAGLSAVAEDVRVGAAGVFEGVRENGQVLEGAVVVDVAGDGRDRAAVPAQPSRVNRDGAEV